MSKAVKSKSLHRICWFNRYIFILIVTVARYFYMYVSLSIYRILSIYYNTDKGSSKPSSVYAIKSFGKTGILLDIIIQYPPKYYQQNWKAEKGWCQRLKTVWWRMKKNVENQSGQMPCASFYGLHQSDPYCR